MFASHSKAADGWVDSAATEDLVNQMSIVLEMDVLDRLTGNDTAFHELSMSRMGFAGNPDLANMLFQKLEAKGLARMTEDGCLLGGP